MVNRKVGRECNDTGLRKIAAASLEKRWTEAIGVGARDSDPLRTRWPSLSSGEEAWSTPEWTVIGARVVRK
ncbi:hypothetical protein L2E82_39199 [Cichorium intybus]|uniref:Uncharacterized protein n=1 Tax=Cichorium intybus TaxID=13427 RepID=A0ACB9AHU3_CICIN|nr:hypothetical protein L2E82_39199 [Cichorium intybus]